MQQPCVSFRTEDYLALFPLGDPWRAPLRVAQQASEAGHVAWLPVGAPRIASPEEGATLAIQRNARRPALTLPLQPPGAQVWGGILMNADTHTKRRCPSAEHMPNTCQAVHAVSHHSTGSWGVVLRAVPLCAAWGIRRVPS